MKSNIKLIPKPIGFLLLVAFFIFNKVSLCQRTNATIEVGVAKIDITPAGPIRLAGYGARSKSESDGIIHRLEAEAMAFGKDAEHPSIVITIDLVGITERITSKVKQQPFRKSRHQSCPGGDLRFSYTWWP